MSRESVREAALNENPLERRLSPEQFDAAVRFYEADQEITPSDRDVIANDLRGVLSTTSFWSYGMATLGFLTPTMYYKLWGPKLPDAWITTPQGTKRVPNPMNSLIRRPFLGFFIGLGTLMLTLQVVGKWQYNKKAQTITNPNERRVWDAMDYRQAGMFYIYFRKTAVDASYQVRDPRSFTRENIYEGFTRRGDAFANALHPQEVSQWDLIRANNGLGIDHAPKKDEE